MMQWIRRVAAMTCVALACALTLTAGEGAARAASGEAKTKPAAPAAKAPETALCVVCAVMGGETEPEKVRATRTHEGVVYGFCSKDCAKEFDADPAAFVPPTFPYPAPDFELLTLEGDTLSLRSLAGTVTLLDFWATWCLPCRKSMPELSAMHDAFADRGVQVVGISIDEDRDDKVREFVTEVGAAYPIAIDRKDAPVWHRYRVRAVPTAFLIDRSGNVVARWTGRTIDRKELEQALAPLLSAD